ncbi:MAG: preprotein translocase subunit SecY [Dehalococcoidales bacterium]|jgi:preprotein translocase subunit SecY|nr:preprotein translocase subunit SecY [Dehalococcoidales bacterium]MDD3994226.1 preprotein translocase subunit SecY [Dehalococcoidales bacterium]NLT28282.1 preprotein translocase subunit SecY [Dehalococcoidales bacterium]
MAKPRLLQAAIDAFRLPDLRRRLLVTFGILVVFRLIAHVPLPGVDSAALAALFENNSLLGMMDLFSGGAMQNFSVAAMGVYPYITASIIMTVMTPVIPKLQAISQEGEAGKSKINNITHWLTIPLAGLAGYGQLVVLQNAGAVAQADVLLTVSMIITMIAGTMFLVWLGEQITEYGIGNGISIIIFAGIVAGLPEMVGDSFLAAQQGQLAGLLTFFVVGLATTVLIVIFTEAHRRIPVQYAKSVFKSGRMYRQSGSSHIPLRVNTAGMIPLIFAMALVMFPGIIGSYFQDVEAQNFWYWVVQIFSADTALPLGIIYWAFYFVLVFAFAFFYTMVIFQQQDLPGVLQRQGGFVPGIRPGKQTATYLTGVIERITWGGALFLAVVAIMPFIVSMVSGVSNMVLSSFGLLIVVGVVLDTMKQMEAQLSMRRYEGFIK